MYVTAPAPYSTIVSTPILCVDRTGGIQKQPFIPRGKKMCDHVSDLENDPRILDEEIDANQIVFSQWLPLPRDDRQLEMSRWFQTMHTVIDIKIEYDPRNQLREYRVIIIFRLNLKFLDILFCQLFCQEIMDLCCLMMNRDACDPQYFVSIVLNFKTQD